MKRDNPTTAVFIDGGWLYSTSHRINKQIDYAKFFNALIKTFGLKTSIYFFGANNPVDKQQKKFYHLLKKIGYIVHNTELTKRGNTFISKGTDIDLTVSAMRILPLVKNFALVSGDSDFVPLLKQAGSYGVAVSVISLPFTTGYLLRKTTGGSFLNLETLIEERKSIKKLPALKKKKENLISDSLYVEKGDFYSSYIHLRDLMVSAKSSIVVIDSYIDDQILAMIKLLKTEIDITILTPKVSPADFCVQVKKLRNEGRAITIYETKTFHDRFIGIDGAWWHSGHSFKDFGSRDSMLNKITEKDSITKLFNRVAKESSNSVELCR